MTLWFINNVPGNYADKESFAAKVISIASALGVNPNWLMYIMNSESGLKPAAYNAASGATGLIQFMPTTATWLGTTTNALAQMTALQQLNYVYNYFKPWAGKYKSGIDLYLIAFYPYAIGKPDSYVIGSERGMAYAKLVAKQNPFDINKDGVVTLGEWKKMLEKAVRIKLKGDETKIEEFLKKKKIEKYIVIAVVIVLLIIGSIIAYNKVRGKNV
jgi:hypothetical protein